MQLIAISARSVFRPQQGALFAAAVFLSLCVASGPAFAVGSFGAVDIYVRNTIPEGTLHFADSVVEAEGLTAISLVVDEAMPDSGNSARSTATGDLTWFSAAASSYGAVATDVNSASSGSATSELKETLTFHVPAGSYPAGVTVTFRGSVSGSSGGNDTTSFYLHYLVRAAGGDGGAYQITDSINGPTSVNETFEFNYPLVSTGTSYASDVDLVMTPYARLIVNAATSNNPGSWGSAQVGLSHMSLEVSDARVGWSAASGVYTGFAPPVPTLGTTGFVILLVVMAGIGVLMAHRQWRHG